MTTAPMTGDAAGVPYVAVPPAGGERPDAPLVLAWHLLDAPRTPTAFAAALPLDGLDAWRVYLGLPLSGARLPAGGPEELMRMAFEDVILRVYEPLVDGAVAELGGALAELRGRLGLGDAAVTGVMGGSIGAAVAQQVMAEGALDVAAAVLVSPVVQLRRAVEAGERLFEHPYAWSPPAEAVADRLDFVARAAELRAPILLAVGEEDDVGFREPAAALAAALPEAELVVVPGMGHALAAEPGTEPAPQLKAAAEVDRRAVAWFRRHFA
jgi:dienelactone hydrolase